MRVDYKDQTADTNNCLQNAFANHCSMSNLQINMIIIEDKNKMLSVATIVFDKKIIFSSFFPTLAIFHN